MPDLVTASSAPHGARARSNSVEFSDDDGQTWHAAQFLDPAHSGCLAAMAIRDGKFRQLPGPALFDLAPATLKAISSPTSTTPIRQLRDPSHSASSRHHLRVEAHGRTVLCFVPVLRQRERHHIVTLLRIQFPVASGADHQVLLALPRVGHRRGIRRGRQLIVHSSFPVSESNACRCGSMVAEVNTNPPAVTIGPPRLIDPVCFPGTNVPSGTSHAIFPVNRSTASVVPHGGRLQGVPLGEKRNDR